MELKKISIYIRFHTQCNQFKGMIDCVYLRAEPMEDILKISKIIRTKNCIGKTFIALTISGRIYMSSFAYFVARKRIRSIVREDVTNEWMPFRPKTIDFFGKLAMEQFPGRTMYPIHYYESVERFSHINQAKSMIFK